MMALYRQIHVDFWQDEIVAELSPEEKYFYLYLMTNNKTTQSGVYRVNLKVMAFDLGYDKSTVEKLLIRFVANGRIKYNEEHTEIFLVNWLKYNSARSPKIAVVIDKQLLDIRTPEFKQEVIRKCIQYGYPIRTVSQPEPEPEPEPETEPTRAEKAETLKPETFKSKPKTLNHLIADLQSRGFRLINNPTFLGRLEGEYREYEHDLIAHLMEIAIEKNVRSFSYLDTILKSWDADGISTLEQLNAKKAEKQKPQRELTPLEKRLARMEETGT